MEATEGFVKNALDNQILDESRPDYGGFRCPDTLLCEPLATACVFTTMTVLFFNKDSDYYHSQDLLQRMKLAISFIAKSQYDDGTIDAYFSGEMHSVLSVAHAMNSLMKAYRFFSRGANYEDIRQLLEAFLKKGANAIKSKQLDKPSHRRIEASVLIEFDKIFLDHQSFMKANDYINNSIDINHDGLYGERSPSESMKSNSMLLNIAKKLNKAYIMEDVRRNLNFSLYNLYPNNEIVTEYSPKPHYEIKMPQGYSVWKEMSIIDHNGYYASAADIVLNEFLKYVNNGYINCQTNNNYSYLKGEFNSRLLVASCIGELLMVEDELDNDGVNRLPLPTNYKKVFPNSNLVRIQNGKTGFTIIGNSSILLSVYNGNVIIDGFRIRYSYFGHRDFIPKKLEFTTKSYILRDQFNQWQPVSMSERLEQVAVDLNILVEFTPTEKGIDIDILASGQKGIPIQLEFGIRKYGKIISNSYEYSLKGTDIFFKDQGDAIIDAYDDQILIRGGKAQHRIYDSRDQWTTNPDITRLLITPITPYSDKIQLIWTKL